jgi:hypothetical protein
MKLKALSIAALVVTTGLAARPSLAQSDFSTRNANNIASNDQAFIQQYKSFIVQLVKNPESRQFLLYSVQKNPRATINMAKAVCKAYSSGLSSNDIIRIESEVLLEQRLSTQQQNARADRFVIINSLATRYYCPEFEGS